MPRTRQLEFNRDVIRLEALPQPVVAYGRDLESGDRVPFHRHRRAQLVYASRGVMTVTTRAASYVVPPQRAVWMPSGVDHKIDAQSDVAMRTLYIAPGEVVGLPEGVCVLQVTSLLRELIVCAVESGPRYAPDSPQSRMMSVILDQIGAQNVAALVLPIPTDLRLLRITNALNENPADRRSLDEWAANVGASKRTIGRLFNAETGMSFQAWRQQRRLLRALELLAMGERVTAVALELGYDNTSAFISMFRRCLGTTPKRYLR